MQRLLDTVSAQLDASLPFVIYRKPKAAIVKALLQEDDTLHHAVNFEETGFVFAPFDTAQASILIPLAHAKAVSSPYVNAEKNESSLPPFQDQALDESKAFHINLVKKGISEIKHTNLEKVVLSRKETIHLEKANALHIFQNLLASYPLAFVYLWYHPKVGLWLGATPETLLKIQGRQFSIMALAGTQNYSGTMAEEWQEKERLEQQFVTDFILNEIQGRVDNIKVSPVETVRAGNLLHLRTLIKGQVRPNAVALKDLLYSLHPTPAVCGLPKAEAQAFILNHENYNRAFYTGFLGELNFEAESKPRTGRRNIENRAYTIPQRSTQLYVNLRCMALEQNQAHVYVGGGITKTSNAEREWEETVSKSLVIKSIL